MAATAALSRPCATPKEPPSRRGAPSPGPHPHDAAERLREVGKGAPESMRARTDPPTQEPAPVEERAAVPIEGGKEPAAR